VPLMHTPGEARADVGDARVGWVERQAHHLAMGLLHSKRGFVPAFPAEVFLEGHFHTFLFWRRASAHSVQEHEDRRGRILTTAGGSRHRRSPGCRVTTCLRRGSGLPPDHNAHGGMCYETGAFLKFNQYDVLDNAGRVRLPD